MGFQTVRCPDCARDYHVEDRWIPELGAKVRCESCDRLLWIPPPSSDNGDMDLLLDLPETGARRIEIPTPEKRSEEPVSTEERSLPGAEAPSPASDREGAPASTPEDPPAPERFKEQLGPDPLEILDEKIRAWIAGRDDQIRIALASGSFFSKFGEEFLEMVEGDPDLTRIEAAIQGRAVSSTTPQGESGEETPSPPHAAENTRETPSWLALSRLRKLLLHNGHSG